MQNNRLLKISTAGSRKATHWQENILSFIQTEDSITGRTVGFR